MFLVYPLLWCVFIDLDTFHFLSFHTFHIFVRDGIYNSVADYNSTWRVLSVCVCVCLSRGKLCYWVTFERFELEGWNFLWCLSMKNLLGGRFFFLIRPPQPPQPPYPLRNPPQYTNFANFGPIWMKLGVEVKNGQQSSNPEWFFDLNPPNHPTPYPPDPPPNTNFANFGPKWMKIGV